MKCDRCLHDPMLHNQGCENGGLIFAKYERRQKRLEEERLDLDEGERESRLAELREAMAQPPGYLHSFTLPSAALWAVFVIWGFGYLVQDIHSLGHGSHFMHAVNLPFHEAGHLIFGIFGENFLDIAPYMADARDGVLPLLGGNYGKSSPYGLHDWEFILGETGLLEYDTVLAAVTLNLGRGIMLLAVIWGGVLLWKAWRASGV